MLFDWMMNIMAKAQKGGNGVAQNRNGRCTRLTHKCNVYHVLAVLACAGQWMPEDWEWRPNYVAEARLPRPCFGVVDQDQVG